MIETPEQYNERMRKRDIEDLRSILKTVYGRRFVWRMMGLAGVFRQSFIAGEADSTAFNEGRRSIGNTLLSEVLEVKPESYTEMAKAAKEDDDVRRAIADAIRND